MLWSLFAYFKTYTSGLTPQFRTLLLAPDSTEHQILRKPTKDPKKEQVQHEVEEKPEIIYQAYKEFEGLTYTFYDLKQLIQEFRKHTLTSY